MRLFIYLRNTEKKKENSLSDYMKSETYFTLQYYLFIFAIMKVSHVLREIYLEKKKSKSLSGHLS